jgi:hypothetical protein
LLSQAAEGTSATVIVNRRQIEERAMFTMVIPHRARRSEASAKLTVFQQSRICGKALLSNDKSIDQPNGAARINVSSRFAERTVATMRSNG